MNLRNITIIVTALVWLNSCHKQCHGVALTAISIVSYDSANDLSVKIIGCVQGSNFAERVDSSEHAIVTARTYANVTGVVSYTFADAGKDYLVVIQPSGVMHKITNIMHGTEKDNSGCGGGAKSICSYGYTVDGQPYTHGAYQEDGNGGETSGIVIP